MNENLSKREKERISSAYMNYAKNAKLTMGQINFRGISMIAWLLSMPFDIWAIVESLVFNAKFSKFLLILLLGVAVGYAAGGLLLAFIYIRLKDFAKLERTEGYSPKFYEEAERLYKEKRLQPLIAADCFIRNGYADRTLEILSTIDSSLIEKNPTNAHMYYAVLMMAYMLNSDMENAHKAYNDGLYYLKTYMNSPAYGDNVSLALGVYEFFCGNHETAAGLLDNSMRIVMASRKPKSRIPEENFIFTISYWKAMCFSAMGNKAAAWDIINSCRSLYTTDYYRKCADKLIKDMAEDEKRKNEVENETIS